MITDFITNGSKIHIVLGGYLRITQLSDPAIVTNISTILRIGKYDSGFILDIRKTILSEIEQFGNAYELKTHVTTLLTLQEVYQSILSLSVQELDKYISDHPPSFLLTPPPNDVPSLIIHLDDGLTLA